MSFDAFISKLIITSKVVGSGDGSGYLPVPERPIALAYSRARVCCACSRCGMGELSFVFVYISSILSFLF